MKRVDIPLVLFTLLFFIPTPASTQSIPVKTVPVASGDQFLFFPIRSTR